MCAAVCSMQMAPSTGWCWGIDLLIEAANYLDKEEKKMDCETEVLDDHGYASSSPIPLRSKARSKALSFGPVTMEIKSRNKSPQQRSNRPLPARQWVADKNLHNLKEKSRRADLRDIMSNLKSLMPHRSGMDKLTTLQLLRCAKSHIKHLEEDGRRNEERFTRLLSRRDSLRSRLVLLSSRVRASESSSDAMSLEETGDVDILSCSTSEEEEESQTTTSHLNRVIPEIIIQHNVASVFL